LVRLKVDGGAAVNDLLIQFQSDVLDVEIVRPRMVETTALGAACLAGLGCGLFSSTEIIAKAWRQDKTFQPSMKPDERKNLLAKWHAAVSKA
jgi:glycerol kinase